MKIVNIKQKLESMGVTLDGIVMGDFDYIGEFTAKRERNPSDPNYKKFGAFYRSNYERGILIYYLIRQFNLSSMLEIGFGRGYSTFCAARAFHDAGIQGKIVTVDPALNKEFINNLGQVFPKDWFSYINFVNGKSQDVLPKLDEKFDLFYIDGDHSYAGTKLDWELTRDKCKSVVLFDDYHLPTKDDPGIQCRQAIDEIDWSAYGFDESELIKLDRRMFFDDRGLTDDLVNYGQVMALKTGVTATNDW